MTKKLCIHTVQSIKGGSGKSSFSFGLATHKEKARNKKSFSLDEYDRKKGRKKSNTLIIDVDFKGTGLNSLLTGLNDRPTRATVGFMEFLSKKEEIKTLNSFFHGTVLSWEELLNTVSFCPRTQSESANDDTLFDPTFIDVICSSDKYSDKRSFLYSKDNKNSSKISVEKFKDDFLVLFGKIINAIQEKKVDYKNIIFDFPPSSDEYSDCVIESIEEVINKCNKEKIEITWNRYIVTTDDRAHLGATLEYLKELLQGGLKNQKLKNEKYNLVINQTVPFSSINQYIGQKDFKSYMKDVEEKIRERLSSEAGLDLAISELKFIEMQFNELFFAIGHFDTMTLENTTSKLNFEILNLD